MILLSRFVSRTQGHFFSLPRGSFDGVRQYGWSLRNCVGVGVVGSACGRCGLESWH